jgi:hypothetical protein
MLLVLEDVAVPHVLVATGARTCRHPNGTVHRSNFMITAVTSLGFILTVSFHPSSVDSGPRAGPVYVAVQL